jgi:hypothetical protein
MPIAASQPVSLKSWYFKALADEARKGCVQRENAIMTLVCRVCAYGELVLPFWQML